MNINLNVIISIITGKKYVNNEEWGVLEEATQYLLKEHIQEWKTKNGVIPYPIYSSETRDLLAKYLLSEHSELEELYGLLSANKGPEYEIPLINAYMSKLPDSFAITPIPASFKVEKEKTH